jgi:hypothetical protein
MLTLAALLTGCGVQREFSHGLDPTPAVTNVSYRAVHSGRELEITGAALGG